APLPWITSDALDTAPASALNARPRVLEGLPAESPGRIFAAVSDPTLLARWTAPEGVWSSDSALRAHAALAGYGNLQAGIAVATPASPIDNPLRVRLLGAALSGGNAATLLGLADVRSLVSPFPPSIPSAHLARRDGGVARYDLPTSLGRVFFTRE